MSKIGIIGAGAIGGSIAALLDAAGHSVLVTARGEQLLSIRSAGIVLTGAFGDHTAKVLANAALGDSAIDMAILTVKAQDTAAAIAANPILRSVPVLVVQNGLGAHERVAALVGHERVAVGISTTAANSVSPGTVRVTAAGSLFIGGPERERFARLLAPVLPGTSTLRNLTGAQWTKLLINMVNAPPALVSMSVQESIGNPHVRRVIAAATRETARVGFSSGVRFAALQGLTPVIVRGIAYGPRLVTHAVLRRMAAVMGDVPNLGSTQQSLVKGAASEIDYLNGAVVEAAAALGRSAPVSARITDLVHRREAGSPALTPSELEHTVLG